MKAKKRTNKPRRIDFPKGDMPIELEKGIYDRFRSVRSEMDAVNLMIPVYNLLHGLKDEFPEIVRHPEKGISHLSISFSWWLSVYFYCCVGNFGELDPILDRLSEFGYKINRKNDDGNNKSRTYYLQSNKAGNREINLTAFALEELGSTCRVVSTGFTEPKQPEEQFVLVCDEIEEKALIADRDDINYK